MGTQRSQNHILKACALNVKDFYFQNTFVNMYVYTYIHMCRYTLFHLHYFITCLINLLFKLVLDVFSC